jgi:hypothetical protein
VSDSQDSYRCVTNYLNIPSEIDINQTPAPPTYQNKKIEQTGFSKYEVINYNDTIMENDDSPLIDTDQKAYFDKEFHEVAGLFKITDK